MASQDIEKLVSECLNIGQGCFAADPNALEVMAYMDDSCIRADLSAVAVAADSAGGAGTPLEDQTYQTVKLKITGRFPSISSVDGWGVSGTYVKGDTIAISDVLSSNEHSDLMRSRVARCAYVCGKSGVMGTCTLKPKENEVVDMDDQVDASYDDPNNWL